MGTARSRAVATHLPHAFDGWPAVCGAIALAAELIVLKFDLNEVEPSSVAVDRLDRHNGFYGDHGPWRTCRHTESNGPLDSS